MIVGFENYQSKYDFSKVKGVIHVGAHIGQEYDQYINFFGEIETHWFEPIGYIYDKLKSNLSGKKNTHLYNFALGEKEDELSIYVDSGNEGQSSSILKPKLHTEQFPHIKFDESCKQKIFTKKLDDFKISSCNVLVIDTQGYELNVLKGSIETLNKIDFIFCEFNTIEMYEGCPRIEEIDNFLNNFGFYRAETWYTDFNWGDALYIKKNKIEDKSIVIIDCFVSNKNIEDKLLEQVNRVKNLNLDVLLISNTKILNDDILSKVDYFIYDKRNQLFECEYENINEIDFIDYVYVGSQHQFTTHKIVPGLQRHGLSVLVNLFNSVKFIKSLGYKNFWRIEVDDLFGEESLRFLMKSDDIVKSNNKKALLYYNSDNISFHFMFWNIDYFLEKIPQIKNEEDYRDLIFSNFNSFEFVIAEEFIWKFLKLNGDDDVLIKNGGSMQLDFPDTIWNTNASMSNIHPKFENCPTSIFNIKGDNKLFLFTKNLSSDEKFRKIILVYEDRVEEINHFLPGFDTWSWNIIDKIPYKFEVYDNEKLLYVEECKEIKNFVEFP